MKIIISHIYSHKNKGDAAIVSVMINQIRSHFQYPQVVLSSIENVKEFEGLKNIGSFFHESIYRNKNTIMRIINSFYVVTSTLLWISFFRLLNIKVDLILTRNVKNIIYNYLNSDLIIAAGGHYLKADNKMIDNVILVLLLHSLLVGILLKKKIVLYSQSIGPFQTAFQKYIARWILNRTNLILLRETISMKFISQIGINQNLIRLSADAAFLFNTNFKTTSTKELKKFIKNSDKRKVGITVREWLDKNKQQKYEREIANFADYLASEKKMDVIFIPQVTCLEYNDDDRIVARRIKKLIKSKENVFFIESEYNHYEIKQIYSELDYLIGTRMHSIIFSLTSYIPSIAIEYEHKTSGIMKEFYLSDYVIRIEDVRSELLINKFDELIKNKESYIKKIKKYLPKQIELCKQAVQSIKDIYSDSTKKKIAIYADTLMSIGGGGRVVIQLANAIDADIIASGFNPSLQKWLPIKTRVIDIGNFSVKYSHPLGYLFEAPLRFFLHKKFDYDLHIFTGQASIYAAKKGNNNVLFCFSPNRVLYDMKRWTLKKSNIFIKILFILYGFIMRPLDQLQVKNKFSEIIAQCENIQRRIYKYYNRNSRVIYSSINIHDYKFKKFGDYFLAVSRLTPEKRMDLIAKAFVKMKDRKLIMVGTGPEEKKIVNIIKTAKNIKLLQNIEEKELMNLYANCLATVFMPMDEDFGLVPVEGMASGKACIAVNQGGCKETVIHNKTGYLINPTIEEIIATVNKFNKTKAEKMKNDCIEWSKKFDINPNLEKWHEVIKSHIK